MSEQSVILTLNTEGMWTLDCLNHDVHHKDYIGLYKDTSCANKDCLTGQYAYQCPYTSKYTYSQASEARYMRYDEASNSYACIARTRPLRADSVGNYYKDDVYPDESWMSMGIKNGKMVINWKTHILARNDWIALYDSTAKQQNDYVQYYWIINQKPPIITDIEPKEGQQLRIYRRTGEWGYKLLGKTKGYPAIESTSCLDVCPYMPSLAQWNMLSRQFPELTWKNVQMNDEETLRYNDIAASLGLHDRWINPLYPIQKNKWLYQSCGCREVEKTSPTANIDVWCDSDGRHAHVSRYCGGSRWESKLGESYRITHGRDELAKGPYGEKAFSFTQPSELGDIMKEQANVQIDATEIAIIKKQAAQVVEDVQKRFTQHYDAWQYSLTSFPFTYCSDTSDYRFANGFDSLVQMGEQILPLVIEKLLEVEEYKALVLYDELQKNTGHTIVYTPDDPITVYVEGEQQRAKRTIKKWLSINR